MFYIDGKRVDFKNNTISIPLNARHLVILNLRKQNNTSFIDKPLLFNQHRENESRFGKLVSLWLEPIHGLFKL
jgi:hypothetical protein